MDVSNRYADVKALCCHAIQDYLKLVAQENWQQKLYKRIKKYKESGATFYYRYQNAYEKMRAVGPMNYGIDNMDISFMGLIVKYLSDCQRTAVFRWRKQRFFCRILRN